MTKRREEMREWFRVRDELGWTIGEVAEAAGIAPGTASWWSRQLREEESASDDDVRFHRVIGDGAGTETGSVDVRVVLRDGVQIEVGDDIDPGKLCAIVVALESRC